METKDLIGFAAVMFFTLLACGGFMSVVVFGIALASVNAALYGMACMVLGSVGYVIATHLD